MCAIRNDSTSAAPGPRRRLRAPAGSRSHASCTAAEPSITPPRMERYQLPPDRVNAEQSTPVASPYIAALASDSLAGAPSVIVGIFAILALAACQHNSSNPPAAATAATVAPTAAGTPAGEGGGESDTV